MKKKSDQDDHPVIRICPVCRQHSFSEPFEKCPVCNWENDYVQENNPEWRNCSNEMSLNDAKRAFAENRKIN